MQYTATLFVMAKRQDSFVEHFSSLRQRYKQTITVHVCSLLISVTVCLSECHGLL